MRAPTNKAWEEFVAWCQSRGLNPVPANPWTVAAYARALERRMRPSTIRKRINDLARIHAEKTRRRLARDPLVLRTLEMIERRAETAKQDGRLFEDEDFLTPAGRRRAKATKKKTGESVKPKPAKKAPAKSKKPSRPGLSGQPRLVSRRKLSR